MKRFIPLIAILLISPMASAVQEKKPDPLKEAKERYRKSLKSYMEGRDTNRDGSLTQEEYVNSENDKVAARKAFDEANKNGDRSLTKSEITEMLGLDKEVKQLEADAKAKAKEKRKAK